MDKEDHEKIKKIQNTITYKATKEKGQKNSLR